MKNGLAMKKIKHIILDKNRTLSESYYPEAMYNCFFAIHLSRNAFVCLVRGENKGVVFMYTTESLLMASVNAFIVLSTQHIYDYCQVNVMHGILL